MGEWIELGNDRRKYRATPVSGEGPGLLLLHAWWGLNETIPSFADAFADAGFVVIAPDLYRGVVVAQARKPVRRLAAHRIQLPSAPSATHSKRASPPSSKRPKTVTYRQSPAGMARVPSALISTL